MNLGDFFSELKRRNVYKVAVAYAVISWLLIQAVSILFPTFEAPPWVMKVFVAAIVLGFPPVVIFSWAFEITPEGIKRESEVETNKSLTRHTGRKIVGITVIVAVLAAGLMVFQLLRPKSHSQLEGGTPATPDTSASPARTGLAGARPSIPEKSIAVLPFENLSDDKNAAYFADGIQEEILTKLASIADLKVISRTSTAKYKSKPEDLKTVSQQLGVATVLEGSVQKAADKVRVNVQLIDARADSHLWAKSYDREIKDVFAVESEVAQEIADSLQAKLSPVEASTLATAPTKDPAAHDLFLKGEHEERLAESSLKVESYEQAAAWYRQAIARDPNFALAMARLVENRMERHWFIEQMSETELAEVRSMAEHALALAPNLAEVHVALGDFYYHGYRQYEPALAEFERALQLQPNSSTALAYLGYVHRRQGQWERCLDELKKALEQDPRNATLAANLPSTYVLLRMWKEAERTARHALEIDPHATEAMRWLLESILSGSGDINEVQRVLATFPAENKILVNSNYGDLSDMIGDRAYVSVFARDFNAALKVCEGADINTTDERRRLSSRVAIRVLAGDLIGAQAEAEKARPLLEERLRERPNEISSMPQLSWVYLALKRNDDALKLARQAANLLPPEKDVLVGNQLLTGLAEIEARTGGTADAIAILRQQLSVPAGGSVSIARLKIDPVWDPIRNDPGFQKLLALKEHVGP
jgi:TolB-like protein/Tfp pilus assembly protein PilF